MSELNRANVLDYLNYHGPLYLTRIENLPARPEKINEYKTWKENITKDILVEITQAPLLTHIEILDKQGAGYLHLLEYEAIELMRCLLRIYRKDHTLIPDKDIHIATVDLDNPDPDRVILRKRTLERAKEIYEKYKDGDNTV